MVGQCQKREATAPAACAQCTITVCVQALQAQGSTLSSTFTLAVASAKHAESNLRCSRVKVAHAKLLKRI